MTPFTGGVWDAGESVRVASDLMLRMLNDEQNILPGFRLRVLWQDERCSEARASFLLADNILAKTFYRYPDLPHKDVNGDGRISTEESMDRELVEGEEVVSPGPVGFLSCGCSRAAGALAPWAYMLRLPMVSSTNTRPELSNREAFPNYFRVVTHEGFLPAALYTTAKTLGILRVALVLGSIEDMESMIPAYVETANQAHMELLGGDLNHLFPGLRGHHLAAMTWAAAVECIRAVRGTAARFVATLMWTARLQLLLCAQASENIRGIVWTTTFYDAQLWLAEGVDYGQGSYNCGSEEILGAANGMIVAQATIWRPNRMRFMTCAPTTSVDDFYREYFLSQGSELGRHGHVPNNYTILAESPLIADALCMYALVLRELLFTSNFSLVELASRSPAAYAAAMDSLGSIDFEGLQGRVQFKPQHADLVARRATTSQLQAARTPCSGPGECGSGADATVQPFGLADDEGFRFLSDNLSLSFHFPDEVYSVTKHGQVDAQLPDFQECADQIYNPASRACEPCAPGQTFVTSLGTCVCAMGQKTVQGGCVACPPGKFSPSVDATTCSDCPAGSFSSNVGQSYCKPCVVGTYARHEASASCHTCGEGHRHPDHWTTLRQIQSETGTDWSYAEGAQTPESCGCNVGSRRNAEGECIVCEEGLDCSRLGDVRVLYGFYSGPNISVFRCHGVASRCVGGPPGASCNEGRMGIACSECKEGLKPASDGRCEPCGRGNLVWGLGLLALALLGLACFFVFLSTSPSRSQEISTIAVSLSSLVASVQVLSIVGFFHVEWEEPLASTFAILRSIGRLNIDVFQVPCLQLPPLLQFVLTAGLILGALLWLVVIYAVVVLVRHDKAQLKQHAYMLKCATGTLMMAFYTTVVSCMLLPWQCETHPNQKLTMHHFQGIVCWESPEHWHMVITGIVGLTCIPLPYFLRIALLVRRFPKRMRSADVGFLKANAFLFGRYKPERYWYSLVVAVRSLCCAILVIVPSLAAQVLLLQGTLCLSLLFCLLFRPWRTRRANNIELVMLICTLMFCAWAALLVQADPRDVVILSHLAVVMLVSLLSTAPTVLLYILCRNYTSCLSKKHYQYFLCHHKAASGAFARLLKQSLLESSHVTREVFLDSDNLESLDHVFNTLASHTEKMVIIGTHMIFRLPWCIGEMTIARLNQLTTTIIEMPDLDMPDLWLIRTCHEQIPNLEGLAAEGISLDEIPETLRWACDLERLEFSSPFGRQAIVSLVQQLTGGRPSEVRASSKETTTLMLCNLKDLEAVAATMLLQKMLFSINGGQLIRLQHFGGEPLPSNVTDLVVVLSQGLLEEDAALQKLVEAVNQGVGLFTVITDDCFRFPGQAELELLGAEKGEATADAVMQMLKAISVPFYSQHASGEALTLGAKELARRLKEAAKARGHHSRTLSEKSGKSASLKPCTSDKTVRPKTSQMSPTITPDGSHSPADLWQRGLNSEKLQLAVLVSTDHKTVII